MTNLATYPRVGGSHPESAAFTNLITAHGIVAPHTNAPYSEAMIFGISGGLGIGYILWEFQAHHAKVLVLGFHNRWQYPIEHYQTLAARLGIPITLVESGSTKSAAATLEKALAAQRPALAWLDRASLPYYQLPAALIGHRGQIAVIFGKVGRDYVVDDLAQQPFLVEAEQLASSRARIGSYKNRLLLVEGAAQPSEFAEVLRESINACVDHLSSSSESFSLPAIQKWAKLMTDAKNKKGWLKIFQDKRGLFSTLSSLYEEIMFNGARGGLRGMYADFLREAMPVLQNERLEAVAAQYDALAAQWNALAEAALPDDVALFADTKRLLHERHTVLMEGGEAWQRTTDLTEQLEAIRSACNTNFPMDDAAVKALFEDLQSRLFALYDGERTAIQALQEANA
jgi:hypothetical protein